MRRAFHFAYGSNLDPARLRRRCPTATPVGPARLDGWRLGFGGHSRTWGGPVATLMRDEHDRVTGLLYELALVDLAVLDRIEGHPLSYRRRLLHVTDGAGRWRRAHIYILPLVNGTLPAPGYLRVLWQAYRHLGFDCEVLVAAAGGVR